MKNAMPRGGAERVVNAALKSHEAPAASPHVRLPSRRPIHKRYASDTRILDEQIKGSASGFHLSLEFVNIGIVLLAYVE
jgi:hypothetical protein